MGVFTKFKELMGFEEYEDEEEMEVEDEGYKQSGYYDRKPVEPKASPSAPSSKFDTSNVVPMQSRTVKAITSAFKLVVIEPKGFDECSKLVDSLKSRKPIIVNLEKLDSDTARKIFDFLGGATYALNGNVQKVANNIFIFAPENVAISAEGESKPYSFGGDLGDSNPWK
ncbi:MAG TPA: cell division protein SepF [Candidatus Copromorpha excrementigallinarum]|uniref:Cell division protein SepF n=1 Tax=Candidatus Allocopromorpha excrementigallinarum TaxID=2840742 RepID=A0A9D1HYM8_9FIRM|nr:cell division protein SepF [Candidatus Copromorpha excrementigallinarum]